MHEIETLMLFVIIMSLYHQVLQCTHQEKSTNSAKMALHKGFSGGQQRTMKYGLVSRDYVLLYRVYQRLLEDYWR